MKVKSPVFYKLFLVIITWYLPIGMSAQQRITTEQYIETYKETAIEKMRDYKIPASITLAQGILESGSGNSDLARKANNHFGIKCHKEWTGKTYYQTDDAPNECFRSYKNAEESFNDHSLFLTQRDRYAGLFLLDISDYKAWAAGLKKAGYATNPRYPELLITIIEKYNLSAYDNLVLNKKVDRDKTEISEISYAFNPVNPSDYKVVGKSKEGRFIHSNNGIKLVFARENETIEAIADEFDVYSYQLYKCNDLKKGHKPEKGMMIYLEKKHRKSAKVKTHKLRDGESLHAVSQLYGIRLDRLYKMNKITAGQKVKIGSQLKVR